MRWFFVFCISVLALTCSKALVISLIYIVPQQGNLDAKLCSWTVVINCGNDLHIDIQDVIISTSECNVNTCECSMSVPESGTNNRVTNANISQTIRTACDNETTCNTKLPAPTDTSKGNIIIVTVYYNCTDVPTTTITTTSVSESTETSSSGQETTGPVSKHSSFTTLTIRSSSSSSSTASTPQISTTSEISDVDNATQTSVTTANAANGDSGSDSSTSVENGTGSNPGNTVTDSGHSGQTTTVPMTKSTPFDPIVNRRDLKKRKTSLTAVSVFVPTVLVLALITIGAIICIRRKRKGRYTGDKTAVLSASQTTSTTDSSDDDNPNQGRTGHSNNTYNQHGGYIPGDYSDIDSPVHVHSNESSEYNTIDLKTFNVVTSDPTYNHIGHSLNYDATTASSYGGPKMAEDTDASYATCGETETVCMDNVYSHTNQGYLENNPSNAKVLAEISNYDHISSFRDGTEAAGDDTYSHIGAEADDIRSKSSVKYVDNYSHVCHVTKSADGTEPQWQMRVMDDNAGSTSEGAQALPVVTDVERDDAPDVGNNSDSEIKDHEYFILEKQF